MKFSNIGEEFHPDNHSFAFSPENPEIIYAGSDGGIYQSADGGMTWSDDINKGLCITQFEFMEQHPTSDQRILAGTQDNGTARYDGSTIFYHSDDGDGGYVCIDPKQPANMWHTYYKLSPAYSEQEGNFGTGSGTQGYSWEDIASSIWNTGPTNFYPPLALDKTNADNVAIGGRILYIDYSRGHDNWSVRLDLGIPDDDLISAINYVNSNLIYVGTNQGRIYQLDKESATQWKHRSIHAAPFPEMRYIWDIGTMPNDESKIIAIVSGFGTGHVFRGEVSSDGGTTWTDISGDLPDNPTNALVIDENNPNVMYVGMDVGVFRTVDGGKNWKPLGEGLPNVQIYDMRLFSPTHLLRVATHGRGMWQLKS